jgi:hypothetical protein
MIVPTRAVVPDDDFASAFADLEAIEPVASVPSVVLDPRREFFLSCPVRQGSDAQKRRAGSARLSVHRWVNAGRSLAQRVPGG